MNIKLICIGLSLAGLPASSCAPAAIAGELPQAVQGEDAPSLPPVRATGFVSECARRTLPSQRQVGEWTGLQNFGQVYAAREEVMADIGRACRKPGIGRVQVVTRPQPAREAQDLVAVALQAR